MTDPLSRRRFIAALAASVVAVGAPLPIGFPRHKIIIAELVSHNHGFPFGTLMMFQQRVVPVGWIIKI